MVESGPGLTQTAAMAKPGYVYIMTNRRNGTLYVGVTGDLVREKHIKAWKRRWKLELIEGVNPAWRDLWADIAPG